MTGTTIAGFFDDLTVVEIADRRNQYVGKLLADGGARVIQIEPLHGSGGRHVGPFVADQPDPNRSLDYWYYNAGKQSVCIDIDRPAGATLVSRLVAQADLFLESRLQDTLAAADLDYATNEARNGRLLQVSLTDFGQDGPWRDYLANDVAHLALGGQMASSGYSEPDVTPIGGQGHQAWHIAGALCMTSIMAALIERLTSGRGQYIDCSIHDCASICTEQAIPAWTYAGQVLYRNTGQHASVRRAAPSNIKAADGRWVNVVATQLTPPLWANILAWMVELGVEGELASPEYHDEVHRALRWREGSEIQEGMTRILARVNGYDAMHRAQGFGLTWSVVQAPEENYELAHWQQRNSFVPIDQPGAPKSVRMPRGPYLIEGTPFQPRAAAPALGADTDAVLTALLGCSQAELSAFRESKVIG